jgi:hypothetical protein
MVTAFFSAAESDTISLSQTDYDIIRLFWRIQCSTNICVGVLRQMLQKPQDCF